MKERFSGSKLQSTRIRAGLSVEALAYCSGVKPKIIARLESGSMNYCRLDTEMLLAKALGVPLRTLYAEKSSE